MSRRTQSWHLWQSDDRSPDAVVYVADGWDPIDSEALVKALRVDGVAGSEFEARALLTVSEIELGYYGVVDNDVVYVRCSESGSTEDGESVDVITAGCFVRIR